MEEEIEGRRQGTLGTADTPGQRRRQAQRLSLPTLDHLEEPVSLLELVNAAARTGSFSAWKDSHWGSGSLASMKRVK